MKSENEVLWIKLLPDRLKGGPKSKFQKQLNASQIQAAASPLSSEPTLPIGMASGGSVHTEKFKHLAEKLKAQGMPAKSAFPIAMSTLGYEGSVKAGHRRKKGYAPGGYTGDEGDAVLADKIENEKTFVDHQGEYYVNAPMVNILGGPEAVEKLIEETAKTRINSSSENQPRVRPELPIMSRMDEGKNFNPISNIRTSFQEGGEAVDFRKDAKVVTGGKMPFDQGPTISPVVAPAPVGTPVSAGTSIPTSTANTIVSPTPTPTPVVAPAPLSFDVNAATYTADMAARQKELAGKAYTADMAARQKELDRKVVSPEPISTTPPPTTTTTTTTLPGQRDVDAATAFIRDLMNGKNPVMAGIINQTLQKHGANTAAGKSELQMRLNAEGITGPAADAAMETYDRNARLGRSQIETALTQEQMQQAQTAAGQLLTAGERERTYQTTQLQAEMTAAIASGNFGAYSAAYQKIHGTVPDVATMQSNFKTAQIQTATKDLDAAMLKTGQATTLATPGVTDALTRLYKANGGQGQPTVDQLQGLLDDYKHAQDPVWQMQKGMSKETILSQFFGGDEGALEKFGWARQTGEAAFRAYVPVMFNGGIDITTDPTTGVKTLTYHWDNLVMQRFLKSSAPTENYATLNEVLSGGFTVPTGQDVNNPGFVIKDNKLYAVTKDATGYKVSMQDESLETDSSKNVSFGGTNLMFNGAQVTNEGTVAAPKYMANGQEVSVDVTKLDASGRPTVTTGGVITPTEFGKPIMYKGATVKAPDDSTDIYWIGAKNGVNYAMDSSGNAYKVNSDGKSTALTDIGEFVKGNTSLTGADLSRLVASGFDASDIAPLVMDRITKTDITFMKDITVGDPLYSAIVSNLALAYPKAGVRDPVTKVITYPTISDYKHSRAR